MRQGGTETPLTIDSSGVLVGEFGGVEAQEARRILVEQWQDDERQRVKDFATSFLRSAENSLAAERRRAEAQVALRAISYGD